MPLESQLKVKAEKNQGIVAFNLDAMDCADPSEDQSFAASKSYT